MASARRRYTSPLTRELSERSPIIKTLYVFLFRIIAVIAVILGLAFLISRILSAKARYQISPQIDVASVNNEIVAYPQENAATGILDAQNSMVTGILSIAQELSDSFGSRPPYSGTTYLAGQELSTSSAIYVLPYIIACESLNRDVKTLDSNNKYSYGRAQIQKGTWNAWSAQSGIIGDPMNATNSPL